MTSYPPSATLRKTPLYTAHSQAGAKIVSFAGYEMPIQYPKGIMGEHNHVRNAAGLFDVSHMGHIMIHGDDLAAKFEGLVVADLLELPENHMKYSLLTNPEGGVIDDLMITRVKGGLYLVVNASRKAVDLAHIQSYLGKDRVEYLPSKSLLALQGPKAAPILSQLVPGIDKLKFMTIAQTSIGGMNAVISRSGYTGEDGYEIAIDAKDAEPVAQLLLKNQDVSWIGLGARDTLRLEAGLCLYGQELDETTTPIEADLKWTLGKRRRIEGNFLGEGIIKQQLQNGAARKRVCIRPDGRNIARGGAEIFLDNKKIGVVTSGTFSPTLNAPIAMGYVETQFSQIGQAVQLSIRDQLVPAKISPAPFVPSRYYRG